MPSIYVFEGVGASAIFQTTKLDLAIETIGLGERSRDAIEKTHLKSTAKAFMPSKVVDYGEISIGYQNDPMRIPWMPRKDPETIEILWPLEPGQTSPTRWTFSGFVMKQSDGELKIGDKVMGEMTIKIDGEITVTPGH
jgi:hypothetical protein